MTEIKRYEAVLVDGVPAHRPSESGRWVKHEDLSALQEQVRALAAENSIQDFIISAVKDLVCESKGVAGWHLNGDIASWDEVLPELNHSETPATNAALREIRAQAVDSFSEDCKVKSSKESHVFWMDASSAAEEYAARIRSGEQP